MFHIFSLLALVVLHAAQTLAQKNWFAQPGPFDDGSFTQPNGPYTVYLNTDMQISWKTTYKRVNLFVIRGEEFADNSINILVNYTGTSHTWRVQTTTSNLTLPFVFRIVDSDGTGEAQRNGGFLSYYFLIKDRSLTSSTTVSSTTSASTSTSSATTSPTNLPNNTPAPTPSDSASSKSSALPIGLGVGLGIPLAVALGAAIFFAMRRHKKNQTSHAAELPPGMPKPEYYAYAPVHGQHGQQQAPIMLQDNQVVEIGSSGPGEYYKSDQQQQQPQQYQQQHPGQYGQQQQYGYGNGRHELQ